MRDAVVLKKNYIKQQAGFTLVEIAVVMIILGIFAGSFLHLYSLYQEQTKMDDTALDRTRIVRALDNFKTRTGRYPCPASYTATTTDPQYGREGNCADTTSVAPGACANGYCVELSERQVPMDDGSMVTPRVRRGALPFRDLYLDEEESYDSYGGRFSYAVTEILTNWQTFSVLRGGISVVDNLTPTPNDVVEPPGSALYFVFSHGKDNVGAYDRYGNEMIPCTGPMIDNENCNTSVNSNQKLAIYRSSPQSDFPIDLYGVTVPVIPATPPAGVNTNMHYDDVVAFMGGEEEPVWKNSDVTPGVVHDTLQPNQNFVMGGTATDQKLNVGGNVKATGNVQSTTICDKNGANCFESYLIGGSGMACANSSDVGTGIANKNIICANPASLTVSCPAGQFIMGFDPVSGAPICSSIVLPVACAASSANVCGTSMPLPASPHGTVISLKGTLTRVEPYLCNNGAWQAQTASGVCTCTASSVTSAPMACGTGYTGTYTSTTTTSCPSGTTTTTNTFTSTCTCAGYTQTATKNCTAPWSGTQSRTRPYTCVSGTPTAGTWTAWGPACTCPPQAPKVKNVACQPNYTGTATQTSTLDTSTCTWIAGPIDYSGCSCNPQTQTRAGTCPVNQTGTTTEERTLNCSSGKWSKWTQVSASCSCVDKTVTQNVGCPSPQVGAHVQQQLQDCNGTAKGPWTDVSNTCAAPAPKKWVAMSKGVGTVSSAPFGTREGDVCSTPGMGTCFVPVGGGQYDRYSCSCQ